MNPLIKTTDLTKRYGDITALDQLTIEIGNTTTGLLGPNGAGKSTAIKLFLGLMSPTSGHIKLFDHVIGRKERTYEQLGYMPEHDCLPSSVSAAEFLTHMAEVSGIPPRHARIRAAETLRHVGLFEDRYRSISTYSTGMKQRVKLAQAFVHDPSLVLLDEPTAGLDPTSRDEMLELIDKVHYEFGIALLISSHLMGDIERTCKKIILLEDGKLVKEGETAAFTKISKEIQIEVTAHQEELTTELANRGITVEKADSLLLATITSDEDYDRIRDALVAAKAPLRRLTPQQQSLTHLFRPSAPKSNKP